MVEEFQESDVVFSDYSSQATNNNPTNKRKKAMAKANAKTKANKRNNNTYSVPMNIPETGIRYIDVIEYDYDYDDDEVGEERLPPHLIVARRINSNRMGCREMACSFCIEDEKGRILKGRHLCEVRNSILRLTGFLET